MHGPDQHLVNHIKHPGLKSDNTLHVIGVCSNPVRYHSRYRLAREWITAMSATNCVKLTVVEAAFGDRSHEIIDEPSPPEFERISVRVKSHAWIKETMINLAFRHISSYDQHAKYFAWIDMDVFFNDPNWAQETLHQLQTFEVVQPWSDAIDLGPNGNITRHYKSFGLQHQRRRPKQKHPGQTYYEYAHSGFAWACTRRFAETTFGAGGANGPFMDWAILGSADHHMAFAMIGETKDTIHKMMHPSFFRKCYEWEAKALKATRGEVGFTPGFIQHRFHGPKGRRYYRERWQILADNKYDPDTMLTHDEQGIATLVGNHRLEHAIYQYNLSRFEDSIEEV
jgi:hypothetical protein